MSASSVLERLTGCVALEPERLYLCCLSPTAALPDFDELASTAVCHVLDPDLVYEPFCADFGPCNLAHTWRICQTIEALLKEGAAAGKPALLLTGTHGHRHANAAAAVGAHAVLMRGLSAEAALRPLAPLLASLPPFRDASSGSMLYGLDVRSVVAGLARAREAGFLRWHAGERFAVEEYEHYEQVENGDLNWIVPGKLLAFSGPSATPRHPSGWRTFVPEDYLPYFRARRVTAVVRLNRRVYDAARFRDNGVRHHELYFPDGSCPTPAILASFLDLAESHPDALAVHCKAGLGRTGVLICAYMIKHHGFSADEAMGYIRVARPGSVIGPQQLYLKTVEAELAAQGAALRALRTRRIAATEHADARADACKAAPGASFEVRVAAGEAACDALARDSSSGELSRAGSASVPSTPSRSSSGAASAPPSSTKRVLARNGQPRKIPLAMDLDKALPHDLEDLGLDEQDTWRLASLPSGGGSRPGRVSSALSSVLVSFRSAVQRTPPGSPEAAPAAAAAN